jgi:hypothetical protein
LVSLETSVFGGLFEMPVAVDAADLSPGGLFLNTDLLLEPGERLLLSFEVPGTRHRVFVGGSVVRCDHDPGRPGFGVAFDRFTGMDERILRTALHRRALRTAPSPDSDGAFRC